MGKLKINLYGGNFQFDVCTSEGSTPKYIEWVKGHHYADVSMYIDNSIKMVTDPRKTNYAWFVEPTCGQQPLIDWAWYNKEWLEQHYELIFTHDRNLMGLSDKMRFVLPNAVPWVKEYKLYPKTKLVSMMASNKTDSSGHRYRQVMVEKFRNDVDLYGHVVRVPKIDALKDYCFSIVMEQCNTYFTEKITDCFATGTIPIFWGTPDIGDYFNTNGIITLDEEFKIEDLSFDLFKSKSYAIQDNFERIHDLHTAEDYIYLKYLT